MRQCSSVYLLALRTQTSTDSACFRSLFSDSPLHYSIPPSPLNAYFEDEPLATGVAGALATFLPTGSGSFGAGLGDRGVLAPVGVRGCGVCKFDSEGDLEGFLSCSEWH